MIIKNIFELTGVEKYIHNGTGPSKSFNLFGENDFETNLKYVSYTQIPPGSSIGYHAHPNEREEIYLILNGEGLLTVNNVQKRVKKGDVIVNKPGWSHGLANDSNRSLDVFIFWVLK